MIDKMTEAEAQEYGPQWGSYMSDSDPGYIMYTAIPPEAPEHRDTMVAWLRDDCLPIASEGEAKGYPEHDGEDDVEQLHRMIAYLEALTY